MTEWRLPRWKQGDRCQVVEHDEATRQPKENDRVMPATVDLADVVYVRVRTDSGAWTAFDQDSGWHAMAGMFRWRLLPGTEDAAMAAGTENSNG